MASVCCSLAPCITAQLNSTASTVCTSLRNQKTTYTIKAHQNRSTSLLLDGSTLSMQREHHQFVAGRVRKSEEIGAKKATQEQSRRWGREVSVKAASGEGIPAAEEFEGGGEEARIEFDISRLEAYTERVRSEVLCVNALVEDEEDQVIVFKGFSSSLTRPTPDDISEPVLPPTAVILSIDRMRAPYKPSKPQYIEAGISWQDFQPSLEEKGL